MLQKSWRGAFRTMQKLPKMRKNVYKLVLACFITAQCSYPSIVSAVVCPFVGLSVYYLWPGSWRKTCFKAFKISYSPDKNLRCVALKKPQYWLNSSGYSFIVKLTGVKKSGLKLMYKNFAFSPEGMRFGVRFVRDFGSFGSLSSGEEENHQWRRSPLCHVNSRFRLLRRALEDLPVQVQRFRQRC